MPNPPSNVEQVARLVAKLQARLGVDADGVREGDATPLRYVVYARKSTDTAEKQERSIGDQIYECKALADRLGLRWKDIIHEEKSAMVSDKREKFRGMLDAIKKGTYDGIIAWAPDRLARNMKEAGEIIDMLDHGVIQDIKFANNFTFNNDPSGKMMLGFAFISAKQFSDNHSQNVTRAIRRKTAEGKWAGSHLKHGYYKDKIHFLLPDDENHALITEAFSMRRAGKQLNEIAAFLRDRGFPVQTKHTKHRKLVIDEKFVSDLLRDPFYAGALIFGGQVINLLEKYPFVPCVSVEDFEANCKVDGIKKSYKLTEVIKERGDIQANLMRRMVICGHCNRPMSTGITKQYYYFRCDTIGCQAKGKSTRGKVVMEAAYAFLDNHPLKTVEGYQRYTDEMAKLAAVKDKEAEKTLKSLQTQRRFAETRVADIKELLHNEDDAVLKREYKNDLKAQLEKVKDLDGKITKLKTQRVNGNDAVVAIGDFIELFQNIANLIRKIDSMADLDFIMRKIFMNFTVTDQKVTEITQNSPFRELCLVADSAMVTSRRVELRFPG
jgi:DNA invertase Pin-like site-specific DNA recombinase